MFSWFGTSKPPPAKEEPLLPPPPTPPIPPPPAAPLSTQKRTPPPSKSDVFSQRSMKQLGLFFAGAGFLFMSTLITRRAVARKTAAAFPKFFQPSLARAAPPGDRAEGSLVALEALNLATLNVASFFVMLTGGAAWALDIASVDDLRRMARRAIDGPGGEGSGTRDEQAEREVEEWLAKVLQGRNRDSKEEEKEGEKKGADGRPRKGD